MQENVGFEESVENLNLVKEFCEKYISPRTFCFNFEDFLYSPYSMKVNKMALVAELFHAFEAQPVPGLIRANHFDLFKDYVKSLSSLFTSLFKSNFALELTLWGQNWFVKTLKRLELSSIGCLY